MSDADSLLDDEADDVTEYDINGTVGIQCEIENDAETYFLTEGISASVEEIDVRATEDMAIASNINLLHGRTVTVNYSLFEQAIPAKLHKIVLLDDTDLILTFIVNAEARDEADEFLKTVRQQAAE